MLLPLIWGPCKRSSSRSNRSIPDLKRAAGNSRQKSRRWKAPYANRSGNRWALGTNAVAHPRHEDADLLVAKQRLLEAETRQLRQLLDAQEQYIAELRRLLGGCG